MSSAKPSRLDQLEALAAENTKSIASLRDAMFEGFEALQAQSEQTYRVIEMSQQIAELRHEQANRRYEQANRRMERLEQIVQSLAKSVQSHCDDQSKHP
jgi:methyl-accepting chemotaxis protein